jgi:hypothetical protein
VGNGTSRKVLDLNLLVGKGDIWGCNALYRDFSPTYLYVADRKMYNEIQKAGYKGIVIFKERIRNTGEYILQIAAGLQYTTIYMIGFDIQNINDYHDHSIYAGSPQYEKYNRTDIKFTLAKETIRAFNLIFLKNSNKIIRVIDPKISWIPDNLEGFKMIKHITYGEFINEINN